MRRCRTLLLASASALLAPLLMSVATSTAPAGAVTSPSGATVRSAATEWKARKAQYGVHITRDVRVRMSDGVVLRVDIFRPARPDGTPAAGRFPVVLTQTPYNKNIPGTNFLNEFLIKRGYVQVIADVRGTGSSEGSWGSFNHREQRDGAELVRWVASTNRLWSNGSVGTYGVSYGAINQLLTAAQRPAGLKATFPIVPAGDVYRDVVASGGQVDAGFIPLWLGLVTATGLVPPAYTATAPDQGLSTLLQHAGGAAAFQGSTVLSAFAGSDQAYDGPFYQSRSVLSVIDRVEVPTFLVGGEYDLFQRGTPLIYERLRANGVVSRLVFGPWTHLQAADAPGLTDAGMGSLDELALRWFDKHVRGVADRALLADVPPVTYYEIGSGRWRSAPRWMPADVRAETLHLDGSAVPGAPGGLTTTPPSQAGADSVLPVPVAGLCSRSASQWTAGILALPPCEDQRLNDSTGTSYETAPLGRDLPLLGPINVSLSVSTTRTDGLLSVHVEDVAPDGSVTRLTGGWQVLSHRAVDRRRVRVVDGQVLQTWHPFTREAQLEVTPGEVMGVDVEVFPTGAVVRKGHRLRITVQQFDVPHLAPTVPQAIGSAGGVVTIHHSPEHPSRVVLPVRR